MAYALALALWDGIGWRITHDRIDSATCPRLYHSWSDLYTYEKLHEIKAAHRDPGGLFYTLAACRGFIMPKTRNAV